MATKYEVFQASTTDGWSKGGFRSAKQAEKFLLSRMLEGPAAHLVKVKRDAEFKELTGQIVSTGVEMEEEEAKRKGYGPWNGTPANSFYRAAQPKPDEPFVLVRINAEEAKKGFLTKLFTPKEDETAKVRAELDKERTRAAALEADAKKWRAEAEQARKEAAEAQRVAEEALAAATDPEGDAAKNSGAKNRR